MIQALLARAKTKRRGQALIFAEVYAKWHPVPAPAVLFLVLGLLAWTSLVAADDPPWEKVALVGSGVEVMMPGKPKVTSRKIYPLPKYESEVHLAGVSIKDGKARFMLAYHDLNFEPVDETKIRDVLDGGIKGSLLNALAKLSKHERIKFGEYPGRHFEYSGKRFGQSIQATSRIYLVGRRMYQITVIHSPGVDVSAETTKFFESFKFATAVDVAPPADPFSTDEEKPSPPAAANKPKTAAGK